MITLQKVKVTFEEYRDLFYEGFGEYNGELGQTVYFILNGDKRVAFCSVYVHNLGALYLQYIASAKDADPGKKFGYYLDTLKALHNLGFPLIMGAINNRNKIALLWALRAGFLIQGVRQATDKELFVEVVHIQPL